MFPQLLCEAVHRLVSKIHHVSLSVVSFPSLGLLWAARGQVLSPLESHRHLGDLAPFLGLSLERNRGFFFRTHPEYLDSPLRPSLQRRAIPSLEKIGSDLQGGELQRKERPCSFGLMFSPKYFACSVRRFPCPEGLGF